MTDERIFEILESLFPHAHCELVHQNVYELTVSVMLSAQTTDIAVNKITGELFKHYPDLHSLAQANRDDLEGLIKTIGLYRNKAKNLVKMAQYALEYYDGTIPNELEKLITLPGVGRKSANVILSEWYHVPAIAVDTHVERVTKRLGLATKNDSVLIVEQNLMNRFPQSRWNRLHHLMIFFGRYQCHARKPQCEGCPFISICSYQNEKKDALD